MAIPPEFAPKRATLIPRSGSAWLLVAANLVPIVGIVVLDWTLLNVMLLFWAESAIIGGFNIAKMVKIDPTKGIPLSAFFTVHFGGFMLGHAAFILSFFDPASPFQGLYNQDWGVLTAAPVQQAGWFGVENIPAYLAPLWPGLTSLVVSHGYSFKVNFLDGKEHEHVTLDEQMMAPYKRIFLMQFTLIAGGWIMMTLNAPMLIVILLILLKIGADLHAHQTEHTWDEDA